MRYPLTLAAVVLGVLASASGVLAGPQAEQLAVAMAQHFIQDRLMGSAREHYHIEFDVAWIYSRPRENLWVVVGGYVSNQNTPNSFTAAVLLECPEFRNVACWSLEKLSINGEIVLDRKRI